ncbi:MAG: site-specific integrase [Planctomycetales bacterium]|nr:site-specific integrase [Planctomycetales bacterium]
MRRTPVKVVKRADKRYLVLRWVDPQTGRPRERSAQTTRRREAQRLAAALEEEIAAGTVDSGALHWDRFRPRYEREHLAELSAKYRSQWTTAANALERLHNPELIRLEDLTASLLSRFSLRLREEGKSPASIAAYLRALRAALGWAERLGLIDRRPRVAMPRQAKGKRMRSRPITLEEFERLLAAVPKVRPKDSRRWERLLHGLWHSGLRISELLRLSWDPGGLLWVDCTHPIPMLGIRAEGQKRRTDQYQPITPEFWALIDCPAESRRGYVFSLPGRKAEQMTAGRVIRIVGDIGRKAGVVTDADTRKCATSHDVGRRPFTTRLGRVLSQAELAEWMRHRSADTTMQYYFHSEAQALAARVWGALGDPAGDPPPGRVEGEPREDSLS